MADADVTIKDAAGVDRKVDTRTVGAGTDEHREVVVLGDAVTADNVAIIDPVGNIRVGLYADDGEPIGVNGPLPIRTFVFEDGVAADGDAGFPILGVRNDAQAARTSTDGDYGFMALDDVGRLRVKVDPIAPTGTLSNVAGSASSVTLLAANAARRGATVWNDSTAILYVKFGTTASATSCTVKMGADAYYEVPFGYTGRMDGIWASATGSARVTEMS